MEIIGVVGSVVGFLAATFVNIWQTNRQQRHAAEVRREEREAAKQLRAEEQGKRELAELPNLYERVTALAMEFIEAEDVGGEAYQQFKPRFRQIKAELLLRGGPTVEETFTQFMRDVQAAQRELDEMRARGYQEEDSFNHDDLRIEPLVEAMREDLESRERGLPPRLPAQIPATTTKHLTSG